MKLHIIGAGCPEPNSDQFGSAFILEANGFRAMVDRGPAHGGFVAGTPQVIDIAIDAGTKRLVLSHASPNFSRSGAKERAIAEIGRRFRGQFHYPTEITTIELTENTANEGQAG